MSRCRAARAVGVLGIGAALLLLPRGAGAQSTPLRRVEVRHALSPGGMLRIWYLGGSIRVMAWNRDSVVVTGTVPADESFRCGGSPEGVKCASDSSPGDQGRLPGAVLDVRVPRRCQLWIKTHGGDISVTGVKGDLDAYSVTGAIDVDADARSANLESMGGDIRVRGSAQTLRAKTAAGEVTLSGTAQDVTVGTVRGGMRLLDARILRGSFTSTDGDILWDGMLARGARLEFSSHSGAIELRLPARTSGEFTIDAFQGAVTSELGPGVLQHAVRPAGDPIAFVLPPAGGGRVTIRNFKGPVTLRRR